jgi:hypothetical protein
LFEIAGFRCAESSGLEAVVASAYREANRMVPMTERRTTRRYDLTLPVVIRATNEPASSLQQGKTRDVSTRGVYFVVDQEVETGSELDITLTLTPEMTHGPEVLVRALGKILRIEARIEDGLARTGVAAVIERFDMIRGVAASA